MTRIQTRLVAALAAIAALAVGAPAAGAQPIGPFTGVPVAPVGGLAGLTNIPTGACISGTAGQGRTGGTDTLVCSGAGLVFVGPSSAVNTTIGPTIITPAFVGTVIVSGGNTAIGP
jgi:hypothetical protein